MTDAANILNLKIDIVSAGWERPPVIISMFARFTLYFIIPRTGSSTTLTENRTTLDLSFLISPDVSTNSIVKVFIKQRRY